MSDKFTAKVIRDRETLYMAKKENGEKEMMIINKYTLNNVLSEYMKQMINLQGETDGSIIIAGGFNSLFSETDKSKWQS